MGYGVPAGRCLLVENAIDIGEFRRHRSPAAAKNELELPRGRLLIGGVGRLSAEKGFDVLFRALARLVADRIDAGLLLLGEGEERKALEELAEALGLRGRVYFAGFRNDTERYFEAMDVFALSSLREGLPNVVLEALAMEVPVVATRIAGVPRVIEDGRNGLLVEPGSVEGLADGLGWLLTDDELRERLRHEGRRTVVQRYSFRARMEKVAAIFDELLSRRRQ